MENPKNVNENFCEVPERKIQRIYLMEINNSLGGENVVA